MSYNLRGYKSLDPRPQHTNPGDLDMFMYFTVKDLKTGKIVLKRKEKCYSLVDNFLRILYCKMGFVTNSGTDTSGSSVSFTAGSEIDPYFLMTAGSSDDDSGIVVGTGTTAAAIDDNNVETRIDDGAGSGQLQYASSTVAAPTVDASTTTLTLTRVFTNDSGGSITINEVCLITQDSPEVLIARDIVSGGIAVGSGQEATINYKIRTTI